jgi:nitrogen fixation protein FixH
MIVIGLLLGHILIMAVAVALATRGESSTVIPGYYQKALNWDRTQAALRASEKLGWTVALAPALDVDPLGRLNVVVNVTDAQGAAVAGAEVELSFVHLAHPAEVQHAQVRTGEEGRAQATLTMRYEGFWQIEVTAKAHGETFVTVLSPFVSNARRGQS